MMSPFTSQNARPRAGERPFLIKATLCTINEIIRDATQTPLAMLTALTWAGSMRAKSVQAILSQSTKYVHKARHCRQLADGLRIKPSIMGTVGAMLTMRDLRTMNHQFAVKGTSCPIGSLVIQEMGQQITARTSTTVVIMAPMRRGLGRDAFLGGMT